MRKPSSVATEKPSSSNTSPWANGPPSQLQQDTSSLSRSPSSTKPVTKKPTHSRKFSVLSPAVSAKDGVSVPKAIVPSSFSHSSSGINFGTIDVNDSSGPSAAASSAIAAPPVVNGSAGTPPPSKDAQATPPPPKAFGSLPAKTPSNYPSSTAASSAAAPSPTPSNASTAATSSAALPKRKLDANKLFQAPTSFAPQQVGSPRLGHQPPVMQQQQQQPPGPVPAPGQMPGQPPYPPQQMQMGWQQPQYGGWQPQYPQYPYMNPEWYSHMQHPHMHQHPHQPPYMQPPGAPHQPFAQSLPPAQQTPTTATMSPRTRPMPTLPPPSSSTPVPHPNVPQINTSVPPSISSTPASARPTTPLTPSARESVTVDESSSPRKAPIRMESKQEKKTRKKKDRKVKGELEAKKRKEAKDKAKKEEEESEAKRKAKEAERFKQEEEECRKKETDKAKREEERPRTIDGLDSVTYPEGIKTPSVELNQGQTMGRKDMYDRDFLLQFPTIYEDKPDNLSSHDALGIERGAGGDDNSGSSFGFTGRNPQYPYLQPEWFPPVLDPQHPHQQYPCQYFG